MIAACQEGGWAPATRLLQPIFTQRFFARGRLWNGITKSFATKWQLTLCGDMQWGLYYTQRRRSIKRALVVHFVCEMISSVGLEGEDSALFIVRTYFKNAVLMRELGFMAHTCCLC